MNYFRFYSKPTDSTKARVAVVGKIVEKSLHIAVARCSEKDQFVKATGRALAEQRLKDKQLVAQVPVSEEFRTNDFVNIAKQIVDITIVTKKVGEKPSNTP